MDSPSILLPRAIGLPPAGDGASPDFFSRYFSLESPSQCWVAGTYRSGLNAARAVHLTEAWLSATVRGYCSIYLVILTQY